MSDSEDDAAFASADEGEPETTGVSKPAPAAESSAKEVKREKKSSLTKDDSKNGNTSKPPSIEKKTQAKANTSGPKPKENVKAEVPPVKKQEEKSKGGKGKKKRGKQTKAEAKDQESGAMQESAAAVDTDETEVKSSAIEASSGDSEKKDEPSIDNSEVERKLKLSETDESTVSETLSSENKPSGPETETVEESNSKQTNLEVESSETEEMKKTELKREDQSVFQSDKANVTSKEKIETSKGDEENRTALDRLSQSSKQKSDSWGSWGNWGSSFMNVASTSVSTFSNQLGEGFTTIMDTVETALGAPPVDELVKEKGPESPPGAEKMDREDEEGSTKTEETKTENPVEPEKPQTEPQSSKGASGGGGWWSGWGVSNLSNLSNISSVVHNTTNIVQKSVQNTSSMVQKSSKTLVTGGLDVLETIGKKTFEVIKDHDPGLTKTKEILFEKTDKPSLSQLLREAQKEEEAKEERKKEEDEALLVNFKALFEENQGYAHLEALEMLSNMCEKTVHSLLEDMSDRKLDSIKAELIRIKQVFERMQEDIDNDDDEDKEHEFGKLVAEHLTEIHLGTTPDKLNKTQQNIREVIAKYFTSDDVSVKELHRTAIQSLAEFTSKSLEQFHKAGELIILQRDTSKHCESRAHSLEKLAKVLSTEVNIIATKFCHCLNKLDENEDPDITSVVTNIYLESSNSIMYIQDALQLLLPCLQQAAIQRSLT